MPVSLGVRLDPGGRHIGTLGAMLSADKYDTPIIASTTPQGTGRASEVSSSHRVIGNEARSRPNDFICCRLISASLICWLISSITFRAVTNGSLISTVAIIVLRDVAKDWQVFLSLLSLGLYPVCPGAQQGWMDVSP